MGWAERKDCVAENIWFGSNSVEGDVFAIDATSQKHSYSVNWTLEISIKSKSGRAINETEVVVTDRNGREVNTMTTDKSGYLSIDLQEYSVKDNIKTMLSPYTVLAGKKKIEVELDKDSEITLEIK
jgi:phosphatidate phosphatase APP1